MASNPLRISGFSPRYFTPAIKPRLKPRLGGRVTPFGISKPKAKPRFAPTFVSGLKPRAPRVPQPRFASTSALIKTASTGTKQPGTRNNSSLLYKPPRQQKPRTGIQTTPRTTGKVRVPQSMKAQSLVPHIPKAPSTRSISRSV